MTSFSKIYVASHKLAGENINDEGPHVKILALLGLTYLLLDAFVWQEEKNKNKVRFQHES